MATQSRASTTDGDVAEQAVRTYLTWCEDSSLLIDQEKVDRLKASLERENDPIKKMKIYTELQTEEQQPEEKYLPAFIEHVQEWAEENGMTADAFTHFKVPRKHLIHAGLQVKGRGGPRKKAGKRVTVDQIIEMVEGTDWEWFTRPMLLQLTGSSAATIASAVDKMVEENLAEETDRPDPNHDGRGKHATVYDLLR